MTASFLFADLPAAARALAAAVPDHVVAEVDVVLALGESATPIAEVVAKRVGSRCELLPIDRGDAPVIGAVPECAGLTVMVVDRGVETGQAAMLAAGALREAGVGRLLLAVAVCPRQAEWILAGAYHEIIAVHRPLGRRSLQWHFIAPLE